jgi:hypothetical protein
MTTGTSITAVLSRVAAASQPAVASPARTVVMTMSIWL